MFFPTSPRPPRATILQVESGIDPSLSGRPDMADKTDMRTSRSSLAMIALGLGVLGISAVKAFDAARTPFALFLAAVILVELFEDADRERSREPIQPDRFRLSCAVQIGRASCRERV